MNYITSTWWALVLLPILAVMGQSNEQQPANNISYLSKPINQFSLDFHNIIAQNRNENVVLSPISVFVLLSMLLEGSGGTTYNQIMRGLHVENLRLIPYYYGVQDLTSRLNRTYGFEDKKFWYHTWYGQDIYRTEYRESKLVLANKIFAGQNITINEKYQNVLNIFYNASVESINFSDSQKASSTINNWVEQKTYNEIKKIVQPDDFNSQTEFVLVNTLYFKGIWKHEFEVANDIVFRKSGKSRNVPSMKCTAKFVNGDFENLAASVIEIPYRFAEETKMVVVLPNEGVSLNEVEKKIKQHGLPTSDNFTDDDVKLTLPKFKFSSTIDLQSNLKKLNMTRLFDNPNFSGITTSKVRIGKMIHKVMINVDEKGTVAAAASVGIPPLVSAWRPKEFVVNRPFLIFIRTRDVILFTGRVVDPTL